MGFFLLEFVDALFDGVLAEEFVDEDGLVLADAVGAVGGLGLSRINGTCLIRAFASKLRW